MTCTRKVMRFIAVLLAAILLWSTIGGGYTLVKAIRFSVLEDNERSEDRATNSARSTETWQVDKYSWRGTFAWDDYLTQRDHDDFESCDSYSNENRFDTLPYNDVELRPPNTTKIQHDTMPSYRADILPFPNRACFPTPAWINQTVDRSDF